MNDTISDILKKQVMRLRATALKIPNGIGDLCLSALYTMENNPKTWICKLIIRKNVTTHPFIFKTSSFANLYSTSISDVSSKLFS